MISLTMLRSLSECAFFSGYYCFFQKHTFEQYVRPYCGSIEQKKNKP